MAIARSGLPLPLTITSIVTPGDAAKIGGRSMTGVEGPSGCVELVDQLAHDTVHRVSLVVNATVPLRISLTSGSLSGCCSSRPSHVSGSAGSEATLASLMPWKMIFEFS
jgi:hypothetical protein